MSKYAWMKVGTKCRMEIGGRRAQWEGSGFMRAQTVSYDGRLCRTGTISGMPFRNPGSSRWVYVKLDPPNYGELFLRAAEIEPVEEQGDG